MKRIYSLLLITILISIIGCSEKEPAQTDTTAIESAPIAPAEKKQLLTFEDSIEYLLNDPWKRALYNDNSGFYDNEFSYLTDDVPLDDYITYGQITFDYGMQIDSLKVHEIQVFAEDDSALVDVEVTMVNKEDGKVQNMRQVISVYKSNGRWIKPTVSVIRFQLEYEDKIRKAIEAAEEEE